MIRVIIIVSLFVQFVCFSQTNISVVYSFVDGTGQPQNVKQVSFAPLGLAISGNSVMATNEFRRVITTTNLAVPLLNNMAYRVRYLVSIQPDVYGACFTNYFGTNVTGTVYAKDYVTFSNNFYSPPQVIYLTSTNVFWNTSTNLSSARSASALWVFRTSPPYNSTNPPPYSLIYTN